MSELRLAVIGDPIAHTLSPLIQGKMMERLGAEGDYRAFHVTEEELPSFVEMAKRELSGFNITIPHKSRILPYLDGIDTYAAQCGAVNTVRITDGKLYGFNTDGNGIVAALRLMGASFQGARVSLLGAGGAALSICKKALEMGAKTVTVFCRNPKKAAGMTEDFRVTVLPFAGMSAGNCGEVSDVIIHATPLGMSGGADDFTDFSFLDGTKAAVCDIVYRPAETSLLKECRRRGLACSNGRNMLIYQAICAFEIFSGMNFDRDEMGAYLAKEVRKVLGQGDKA